MITHIEIYARSMMLTGADEARDIGLGVLLYRLTVRLSRLIDSLIGAFHAWNLRVVTERELAALDDRILEDIGIDRYTIRAQVDHLIRERTRRNKLEIESTRTLAA